MEGAYQFLTRKIMERKTVFFTQEEKRTILTIIGWDPDTSDTCPGCEKRFTLYDFFFFPPKDGVMPRETPVRCSCGTILRIGVNDVQGPINPPGLHMEVVGVLETEEDLYGDDEEEE